MIWRKKNALLYWTYNTLVSFSVEALPSQGRYDLHISHADYARDNGKFECRIKEDGTGKLLPPLHSYAAS